MKTKSVKVFLSAVIVLLMAWAFTSCSKKKDAAPVVTKTELTVSITAASALLSTTHEGVAAGNYIKGSQAALVAAVAQAQGVADDATVTQVQVSAATANLAAAVAIYQTNLVTAIDPTNLVGQWTFDEITSAVADAVVKDYSGSTRDGALKAGAAYWTGSGVPTLAADRYGIAGKALHFDKGQNVEIPYNASLNPQLISISLWAKQDAVTPIFADQYMVAMNRWNGYKFQFQSSPQPFFTAHVAKTPGDSTIYDHDAAVTGGLAQGTWYHVVVTLGSGHMIFYVNGVLTKDWGAIAGEATPGTIVSLAAKPVNLTIGQDLPTSKYSVDPNSPYYVNWGGYFKGTLDEVRIYKSVLTQAQVTSIYTLEKP